MNTQPISFAAPVARIHEMDRVRIERALHQRVRYRYVQPKVQRAEVGWVITSPCCSRNIDPKGGVIDIANTTGAFTTNVLPEGDAWKLTEKPMSELRKNGVLPWLRPDWRRRLQPFGWCCPDGMRYKCRLVVWSGVDVRQAE